MKKYHLSFDKSDPRDKIFSLNRQVSLPDNVDLRSYFIAEPYDQGELGSCTANALVGHREYLLTYSRLPYTHLSRLFLYYFERVIEGTVNQDSGASLRDGFKVLNKMGVSPEGDDEYNIQTFTQRPSDKAIADASQFKISAYHRITSVDDLQASLASSMPVAIGFKVYESFESDEAANTGIIPIPKSNERYLGGHAVLAVGYKNINNKLYFIIRNSWGTQWGDHGYCYMPVELFQNGIVVDMWTGK